MSDERSNSHRFLTPDDAPTATRCRRIRIPDSEAWLALVSGALVELIDADHWEQFGTLTPQEAAERAQAMFLEYLRDDTCMIGTIQAYATASPPDNCLPCDGGLYDATIWPELYDAIDPAFKLVGSFYVPDLRGRTIIGSGTGGGLTARNLAEFAGEESHMLGYTELFPHNHATEQTNDISVLIPAVGTATDISGPSFATNTGVTPIFDQTPLNVMQPFFVLNYYIVAR